MKRFNLKTMISGLLLFFLCAISYGQSITVRGTITDSEAGGPLPGATVREKGTDNGVIANNDGTYSVTVAPNATLVFSFVGFTTKEVAVNNQTTLNVILSPSIENLDEVVVVGYGTQRKQDLTGAVSLVDPVEMKKQASNDVTQMMQGRVAGVSITSDGQPGAAPTVRIRGISTFGLGAGSQPLYVVDGFPISGGIRDINPNDIESIQVLKDATAGAIYGNRAANGVIIVTTKSGSKNQRLSVSYNTYYGFQKITQKIPVLDRVGYQTINSELLSNAGQALVPGNDPGSNLYVDNVNTDWQDEGYQDGYIMNHNLNFTGGSEATSYFVSLDYLDNKGTLVGNGPDYKRYSFRVNTETDLGKFKFGENLYVMRSDENPLFNTASINLPGGRPTLVNDLLQAAPTIPLYDPSRLGGFGGADAVQHQSITLNVPGLNTLIDNNTVVNRVLANIYGELEIIPGLKYKLNLQYDNTDITDQLFVPQYDLGYFFPGPTAQLRVGTRHSSSYLVENTLNYEKTFGDKHDLKVLLGQTFQDFDFRGINSIGVGFDAPYVKTLSNAASFSVTENLQPSAIASFLGRVNYNYDDRYLLTFNIRRDGSSRFREEDRFAYFPSVGVAWKIHNDFQLPAVIEELKLRGGYGQVGNQEIGNFRFQSTINRAIPYEYSSGRVLGAATTILIDPAITWETRITRNVALDAVLFDGRIEFTAEYYSNTSQDVLLDLPIPLSNGSLSGLTTNAGEIENSGIELSAIIKQQIGDFNIEIAPNFYTVKNEVKDIGPLEFISGTGARTVVGGAIGRHYGWVYDGIFQNTSEINTVQPGAAGYDASRHAFQSAFTSPGDVIFRDLNDDGVINEEDRTYLGNGLPTYYYGINIAVSYKDFDFTLFGSGSGGNLINSNLYRGLMPTSGYTNWHEDILNRWTDSNPNTDVPRVVWNDPNNNGRDSNRPGWLQKGDYFRINTISLGYNLPKSFIEGAFLNSARVYMTIQNLHVFKSYKGYNPDFQSGILNPGFDFGTYPRPVTTMLGVQLKF